MPLADARRVFEVNIFGAAGLTQLVLPSMRTQGGGTIVNISSIGGEAAFALAGWYYASKHALEGWTDSLRQEVARFGVRVVQIQPGIIRSAFEQDTARLLHETSEHDAYRDVAEKMARRVEASNRASDPAVVGRAVRRAVGASAPRPRYAVGYLARTVLTLNWLLTDRAFDAIATR